MQIRWVQIRNLSTLSRYKSGREKQSIRINSEDQYNNIWALSYDDQAYLFNPQTELFTGVQSLEYYNNRPFYTTKILHTKSGKTWLISEENGCICVNDSIFGADIFTIGNHNLTDNFVTTVYEDKSHNAWILTRSGITFLSPDHRRRIIYFNSASETPYKKPYHFCGHEFGGEIWFGSSEGSIWKFNIDKKHLLN